jgi:hypothetical protein
MTLLTSQRAARVVDGRILIIRGERVILDADLAAIYRVSTRALNQAVKRNARRFPGDFRFQLSRAERTEVVTNRDHLRHLRFARTRPWAFTEHGAMMAATVLNSARAAEMSVVIVRAFVRLRRLTRGHADLAAKLNAIEQRVGAHDQELTQVFAVLRRLLAVPQTPRRPIGFSPSPGPRAGRTAARRA